MGCQDIEKGLEKNKELDFENAATELYKTAGGGVFFRNICKSIFNKNVTESQIAGTAVELLPQLFGSRLVITTNYDNVLSDVYARTMDGVPMTVVHLKNEIVAKTALFDMAPAFIKLHGGFWRRRRLYFNKRAV